MSFACFPASKIPAHGWCVERTFSQIRERERTHDKCRDDSRHGRQKCLRHDDSKVISVTYKQQAKLSGIGRFRLLSQWPQKLPVIEAEGRFNSPTFCEEA